MATIVVELVAVVSSEVAGLAAAVAVLKVTIVVELASEVAATVAALATVVALKVALAAFFRGCLGNKFRGHFLGSCFSNSST
jgi:hypothetical protein